MRVASRALLRHPASNFTSHLSEAQTAAANAAIAGHSCLITGGGGAGKTRVLRHVARALQMQNCVHVPNQRISSDQIHRNVAVTALTGTAALPISGRTLHAFAGIGLADQTTFDQAWKQLSSGARKRWREVDSLVVDEISMCPPRLFVMLDLVARKARGRPLEPFGGLHVVFFGDFFQLPPVVAGQRKAAGNRNRLAKRPLHHSVSPEASALRKNSATAALSTALAAAASADDWSVLLPPDADFVFELPGWRELVGNRVFELDEVWRQAGDPILASLLRRIRRGEQTEEDLAVLRSRVISEQQAAEEFKEYDRQQSSSASHPAAIRVRSLNTPNGSETVAVQMAGKPAAAADTPKSPPPKTWADLTRSKHPTQPASHSAKSHITRSLDSRTQTATHTLMPAPEVRNTVLFARRADADAVNRSQLARLPGDPVVFKAVSGCTASTAYQRHSLLRRLTRQTPAAEEIQLKRGAQVMLIANLDMDKGLVNGARGVVLGFAAITGHPVVEFASGLKVIIAPHKWSISGESSGTASSSKSATDKKTAARAAEDADEDGANVMLGYDPDEDNQLGFELASEDDEYDSSLPAHGEPDLSAALPPEFSFSTPDRGASWAAARVQIPLQLAWATTIHKSQGMTLDRLTVDIGPNVFEHGQAYVALSRARSLAGLSLIDLDPESITAHPKVVEFYKQVRDSAISSEDAAGLSPAPTTASSSRRLTKDIINMLRVPELRRVLREAGHEPATDGRGRSASRTALIEQAIRSIL